MANSAPAQGTFADRNKRVLDPGTGRSGNFPGNAANGNRGRGPAKISRTAAAVPESRAKASTLGVRRLEDSSGLTGASTVAAKSEAAHRKTGNFALGPIARARAGKGVPARDLSVLKAGPSRESTKTGMVVQPNSLARGSPAASAMSVAGTALLVSPENASRTAGADPSVSPENASRAASGRVRDLAAVGRAGNRAADPYTVI